MPLDRVVSEINIIDDIEYIPAPNGFYQDFFNNIIGVTHEKNAKVEDVIIRTKTEFNVVISSRPCIRGLLHHHSQRWDSPSTLYLRYRQQQSSPICRIGRTSDLTSPERIDD